LEAAAVVIRCNKQMQLFSHKTTSTNFNKKIPYAASATEGIGSFRCHIGQERLPRNFAPNAPEMGWNGTTRNKPAQPGVYVFRAVLLLSDGTLKEVAGDVTVLR
jgi:hypothetical protein